MSHLATAGEPPVHDVIVLNDTRVDRHHGCSAVMRTMGDALASAGFRIAASVPAHSDWRSDANFVAALRTARLVVVNGEGTLHHDRSAGLRLLKVAAFARDRGMATALVNAGWESNGSAYAAEARIFDLVAVRDSRSAAELSELGIACRTVPDFSLCSPAPPASAARHGVAVTDSVDRDVSLQLDTLRRKCGAHVLSIHDLHKGDDSWSFHRAIVARADVVRPLRVLALLQARRAQWQHARCGVGPFLEQLAALELVVSGRFHACTLALVAGTPFIAAGTNTQKIRAMVADAGIESWRCEAALTPAGVEAARHRGWSSRERLAISAYIERAHESTAALFADLRLLVL